MVKPTVQKHFLEDQYDRESVQVYKNKLVSGLIGSVDSFEQEVS